MCKQQEELNITIEDADKILLKVDSSATNKMTTLMQDQKKETSKTSAAKKLLPKKEEKKEVSNKLLNMMYPASKLNSPLCSGCSWSKQFSRDAN